MSELSNLIISELKNTPNQKAKAIAKKLGVDKKAINHALHIDLKNEVQQSDDYSWCLTETNGKEIGYKMDSSTKSQLNNNFAFDSLQAIRNRLLDLTGRNRLLNFKHGKTGFIRVIDEMPDQLASNILEGNEFTFIPIDEPLREELIKHGYIVIKEDGQEEKVKADPSSKDWAKVKGFNTSYELPLSTRSKDSKHNDTNIQSLLFPRELEAQLRNIRTKANTAIEETGANILYLAFGFLEWFEDEKSDVKRQAPLYLIPVKIDRASLNKDLGTYTYTIEYTGEDIISNLSLREKLKHDFHLELPELIEDVLPEEYLKKVESQLKRHKPAWKVKRYSTLSMFDFSKLLMYLDLDPSRWPQGSSNIQNHAILQKFFAKQGIDGGENNTSFGEEYLIDKLDEVHNNYPLIDDADSSQHSALVDAIQGKNLVIEGPPGSGKSQTITNLIAAAIAQGKKVLFVAEKMAALQVVKSRLSRAGLGDFCLELHSHKTQKKQVYENLAQRINNQDKYRYPSSIDIDIKMYEEKKEILSSYANLINSKWKNTGRTIHQIFSTATRYREEFASINLQDIKPDHINGQSFDEISSRRTTDELKKYADVYSEVKMQLGAESELSDHPWFGLYNKSIQLFDCEDICTLLAAWNKDIFLLEQSIQPLHDQIGSSAISDISTLEEILADNHKLPALKGTEDLSSLKLITTEKEIALKEYIKQFKLVKTRLETLDNLFESAAFNNNEKFHLLETSCNNLLQKCKNNDLQLTSLYQQLMSLTKLKDISLSIADDLRILIEQDRSLSELLSPSFNGFGECKKFLEHVNSLDVTLVSRRHELFDNELLDIHLANLEELLPKINSLHKELESHFKLDSLPTANELEEINSIIKNAGLFCWLSSEWRAAKSKLFLCAKGLKPKVKSLKPLLTNLICYRKLVEELHKEPAYQDLLKHEFKGIETPVSELVSIRLWYKGIRASYGVGFGQRVAFANSLFSIENEIFKGLKHLAASKTLSELEQFFELFPQLERVFSHQLFENKNLDLSTDIGISSFTNEIEGNIKALQSLCKKDFTLRVLPQAIQRISVFINDEASLDNNLVSQEIFGENILLTVRACSKTQLLKIESTLELRKAMSSLESELLKRYLLDNISAYSLSLLKSNIDNISASYNNYKQSLLKFADRVELDETAWFKGTSRKFELLKERNNKAISQPRWLSTWVDFIRVRTSLSDKGLENLLRYTETGALNLDEIEQIYIYSVFDILAREIINENQQLAYFSGADQNAIRKQFKEYDNKLKTLQQEKIAYQVANNGFSNTESGVSSGKVASYTEMGLINNEVNKKTRHAPIRQLIRRSSQSLLALKPCFMMGPHSVAQYLAPGQLEFDLVVMDEASQIKPEDALGTIARGKQLVVVGDPKQLPPTSFFDKAIENDEEDVTAIEQSESILDVTFPMFNSRRLRWHYRSRHESLIAFSNQAFYDSNLVVFPSPSSESDEFGIKFTHVKSGRFVNQHNIEEAKVIAEAVRSHLLHRPHESLGVVAMSSKQREQIERCVEELSKDDIQFRDALAENANNEEALFLKNLENVQGDERDVIYISCTYGPQEAGAAHMPQRFGPINSAAGGRRLNVLFTRSKKRMHVFSSMTEGHIVVSETSSAGVHALKNFLSYVQTGKLQQQKVTGKQPDSDFEISVMNALRLEGFNCIPQVGVAGYFIDLAVQDPGQPGRYLMGIECDGATYHSAKSARDRDRLRQSVLEGLGWNIKRIWSTDWFKNPQAQLKPIIEALHKLKTEVTTLDTSISDVERIESVIEHENQIVNSIDAFSHNDEKLEAKLQKFDECVIPKDDDVPMANRLLRPSMIDALCEFKPITKSEFLEKVPPYLRSATSKEHGKYLEKVLGIIAEDEVQI